MFYDINGNLVKKDAKYYRSFKDNIDLWPSAQFAHMRNSSTRVPSLAPLPDPDLLRIKKAVNKIKKGSWKPKVNIKSNVVRFEQKKPSSITNYVNYVWKRASSPVLPNIKIPSLIPSVSNNGSDSYVPYGVSYGSASYKSASPLSVPTRSASLTSVVEGFVSPVGALSSLGSIGGNTTWSSIGHNSVSNSPRSVRSGFYDYRGVYHSPPLLRKITPPPITPPESPEPELR
jgi:hypothetical protein